MGTENVFVCFCLLHCSWVLDHLAKEQEQLENAARLFRQRELEAAKQKDNTGSELLVRPSILHALLLFSLPSCRSFKVNLELFWEHVHG